MERDRRQACPPFLAGTADPGAATCAELGHRPARDGRPRHGGDSRAVALGGTGTDPRRRPADRRTLGQSQRRRQPDDGRARGNVARRSGEADPRRRTLRRRPRIDGARSHDWAGHAAAPWRRDARGDRGGDRPDCTERRVALGRRSPQIARPAQEPLRACSAGASQCHECWRRRGPAGVRPQSADRRHADLQSQPDGRPRRGGRQPLRTAACPRPARH